MKAIITFLLFFFFLLIRSGNSHEVINYSDRPAISFMENHLVNDLSAKQHDFQHLKFTKTNSSGLVGHGNHLVIEQESEDFQLWKDYQLQMAFFSCLIAFTFLLVLPQKSENGPLGFVLENNSNPIFISQRSLRI